MNKIKTHIDSEIISAAIEKFEKEIDFEFIPVIAKKSSSTAHVPWILSLLFLLIFVGVIDYILQDSYASKIPYFVMAPLGSISLGFFLSRFDIVCRAFVSKNERRRQVHENAERIFFKKKLHESASHNSLLLFISVLERQIVLLPDPRTNIENIKEMNVRLLSLLQKAFKKQQYQQGLLAALDLLRSELSHKHKKTSETPNQISNTLIWWRD